MCAGDPLSRWKLTFRWVAEDAPTTTSVTASDQNVSRRLLPSSPVRAGLILRSDGIYESMDNNLASHFGATLEPR